MRIDVTRAEFEAIINRLKGLDLKSERKLVASLAQRLDWQLYPSKAPDKGGWAPIKSRGHIKSSWPTGLINPTKKKNWSFDKPEKEKTTNKVPRKPLTADEILAEL
jgi:hypothetical protein